MNSDFEEQLMEIQGDLISLCLELTGHEIDKVYAYASIEKKSAMFNAFFVKSGKTYTLNQLDIGRKDMMEFLKTGTRDLEKIKDLCSKNNTKVPTEIKMIYTLESQKFSADYQYDEVCSEKTGLSAGEVFMKWLDEIKNTL